MRRLSPELLSVLLDTAGLASITNVARAANHASVFFIFVTACKNIARRVRLLRKMYPLSKDRRVIDPHRHLPQHGAMGQDHAHEHGHDHGWRPLAVQSAICAALGLTALVVQRVQYADAPDVSALPPLPAFIHRPPIRRSCARPVRPVACRSR